MFKKSTENAYIKVLDGIERKTLVYGDKTLMTEFRLKEGSALPMHTHPNEQTGYLVSGCIRLTIGSDEFEVLPGDSWCIPSNVEHSAEIREDAIAIEVFSPTREDYLP